MTTGQFIIYELIGLLALLGVFMYWDYYIWNDFEKKLAKLQGIDQELAHRVVKLLRNKSYVGRKTN